MSMFEEYGTFKHILFQHFDIYALEYITNNIFNRIRTKAIWAQLFKTNDVVS